LGGIVSAATARQAACDAELGRSRRLVPRQATFASFDGSMQG